MPNAVDRPNLVKELKSAAAATIMPLLKQGISEVEAGGFIDEMTVLVAEIAVTGEFGLLEEIKELIPLKIAAYKLRAAATANLAMVNGLMIVAKAARAGLMAVAGPAGAVLTAVADAAGEAPPADPQS